jgi:hypothetical protein
MGLDQYLKASITLPAYAELRTEAQTDAAKELGDLRNLILQQLKLQAATTQSFGMLDIPGTVAVTLDCAYWRKANQIHAWFDTQHQERAGKPLENCEEMQVSMDQLRRLVKLCEELLESRDPIAATRKLPPQAGFFFGSTDMGEWYWADLEETVKQLKPWTQLPDEMGKWLSFSYHGWW